MTNADAYRFLEALRWGEGEPTCPRCDNRGAIYINPRNGVSRRTSNRDGVMSERRVWKCRTCRKQFSALTGTPFHGTRIPANVLVSVLADGPVIEGISVRKLAARHPIDHTTARRILLKAGQA